MRDTYADHEAAAWAINLRAQEVARKEWNEAVILEGRTPSQQFKRDLRDYHATPQRDRPDWLVRWLKRRMHHLEETLSYTTDDDLRMMMQDDLERLRRELAGS